MTASRVDTGWIPAATKPDTGSRHARCMTTSLRAQRTLAAAVTAILTASLGACSSDASHTASAARPSLESAAHSVTDRHPGTRFSYVALGDSWANGAHCGFCETFVGRYADKLNAHDPDLVRLDDRTENGGTTTTMLNELRTSADVRRSLAGADIVVIETGLNDLDETGALDRVAAGTCGGTHGHRCLLAMGKRWNRNFEAIARTIDRLRAGRPTALRLVTSQNVFVSDPSIVTDYGLPDDFALTGGRLLTRMLTTAICRTAHHHGGQCIDVARLFNGQRGDQPRDENTPESMNLVATALFDTGLRELE